MFYIQINATGKYLGQDRVSEVVELEYAEAYESKQEAYGTGDVAGVDWDYCDIVEID